MAHWPSTTEWLPEFPAPSNAARQDVSGRQAVTRALRLGTRFCSPMCALTHAGPQTVKNVQVNDRILYAVCMDVAISKLRAELASWIQRARDGEEIIVTERGAPVARLLPVDSAPLLEQLTQSGVLSKPQRADRPTAGRTTRVHARGPVAELVSEQRR